MKDRIKTLMESQHMTQQLFADFLGINPATLSGIFNDRTKPTINIVEAVKKKFPDISLDWLMFGTGSMYQSAATPDAVVPPTPPNPTVAPNQAPPRSTWTPEPTLDFGESLAPTPTTHYATPSSGHYNGARNTRPEVIREEVKIIDKPARRVTEIRVYYDDQTWESFVPAKK
ncbi:MAG: helix-turn-helix transcriptional regulator [Prevotella sp.]|nr:helix-turn-helix transcriptional regulator [Prevotella sp.]